jgi:hypothetical protein
MSPFNEGATLKYIGIMPFHAGWDADVLNSHNNITLTILRSVKIGLI